MLYYYIYVYKNPLSLFVIKEIKIAGYNCIQYSFFVLLASKLIQILNLQVNIKKILKKVKKTEEESGRKKTQDAGPKAQGRKQITK